MSLCVVGIQVRVLDNLVPKVLCGSGDGVKRCEWWFVERLEVPRGALGSWEIEDQGAVETGVAGAGGGQCVGGVQHDDVSLVHEFVQSRYIYLLFNGQGITTCIIAPMQSARRFHTATSAVVEFLYLQQYEPRAREQAPPM